jgi:hypothetical protein
LEHILSQNLHQKTKTFRAKDGAITETFFFNAIEPLSTKFFEF